MATGVAGGDGAAIATWLGVGTVALLLGLWLLYTRATALGRWWTRRGATAVVDPAAAPRTGYATVGGEAGATGDSTITAPLSGREGIGYAYEIEQHTAGVGWWTVADGGDAVPFRVRGEDGSIRVDPGGEPPDVELRSSEVDVGATLPDAARERMRASEQFDIDEWPEYLMGSLGDMRRYGEGVLEPGEEVYVTGTRETQPGTNPPTIGAETSVPFRIGTDPPPADLDAETGRPAGLIVGTVVGLAFVLAGGVVLGRTAGPALEAANALLAATLTGIHR